jgi:hypothetical protein
METASPADGCQQNGGSAVRFDENQTEHRGNQQARQNHAPFQGMHESLAALAIPGKHDDEREFAKFGRLQAHSRKNEPAPGAVDDPRDAVRQRQQHQHEQHQREDEKRPRRPFEPLIVEDGRRHAQDETERAPDELQHQIMRADLRHARAVKHHQPQRQQGGDTKRQCSDGDFHFNVSKPAAVWLAAAVSSQRRPERALQ